jgi:hypothetical protein
MIGSFYHLIIGIALSVSLFSLWKNSGNERTHQKVIALILLLGLALELVGYYTASKGINNSLIYNLGFVYLDSSLLIFYLGLLEINKRFRKKIFIITIGLFFWGIFNSVFFQSLVLEFQFFSLLPYGLFILFLVIRFLTQIMRLKVYPDHQLVLLPHFWICSAILFFYVEVLFLFGTYQFNPQFVVEHVKLLFGFNKLLAGIMYFIFGISFLFPRLEKFTLSKNQVGFFLLFFPKISIILYFPLKF